MLASQTMLDTLAGRIERAYRLRRRHWQGSCSTSGVWAVAATTLFQVHADDPLIPLDPELFVAAQSFASAFPDPWVDLTQDDCGRRYRRRVRVIVRALHNELTDEIRLAENRVGAGQAIGRVLKAPSRRLSPLGRYIVARRAGRSALADRFVIDAVHQHRACPLYQQACAGLLPDEVYPVSASSEAATVRDTNHEVRSRGQTHLN